MVKVSIIVPVYNADKYLESCIRSLIHQTLTTSEFIFVNDGSTDNSEQIILQYKEKDQRIKLISQKNCGVSNARNQGLKNAAGEYIGFVDADDYVEPELFETLYNSAVKHNSDVVFSNIVSEIEGYKVVTRYPFPVGEILEKDYINTEIIPYYIKEDNLNSVCNKIYKREELKKHAIFFSEKTQLGEDGLFNITIMSRINNLIYLDYSGYHYREVEGSATRNILEKNYFERAIKVYNMELPEEILDKVNIEKLKELKSIKLINNLLSYIHVYFKPSKSVSFYYRYNYIKEMVNNKNVRHSLGIYFRLQQPQLNRYEKFILNMVKKKSLAGLYFATTYSRIRNKYGGFSV